MLPVRSLKSLLRRCLIVIIVAGTLQLTAAPAIAQLPFLPQITWETFDLSQDPNNAVVSACVRLDGRCVFDLVDKKSNLAQRIKYTEDRLAEVGKDYFARDVNLNVYTETQAGDENIYVTVGDRTVPVITLDAKDAAARGINLKHQAQQIANRLNYELKEAKEARQARNLIEQAKLAGAILLGVIFTELVIVDGLRRSRKVKTELRSNNVSLPQPFADYLNDKQKLNLRQLQYRLLQVMQLSVLVGGILLILGLFPQTRTLQIWLITLIRIPLRIAIAGLGTYVLIRLSNIIIAKLNATLADNYVMTRDIRRRTQVRITTITRLIGGTMAILWIILGIIVGLTLIGINVTPLLAGAGIIGLAFSFASQNIIKDALNGFFIILEDQYAVGDVINVNDVGGMVENLNLRITQLRDGQGRLITIPNSEIRTVANLSSQWSRAELDIPIAYQANIDLALELIGRVAKEMDGESQWQDLIIETPEVLGIDNFSDRGSVVRIWIKTEPLKQWVVAREFRRRLQKTFEKHNIPLPTSQQNVWLK